LNTTTTASPPPSSTVRTRAAHHTCFFFFNHPAPTEIYTLSLHDALPICQGPRSRAVGAERRAHPGIRRHRPRHGEGRPAAVGRRSEEHTSELQSRSDLVCRLLLEKKKRELMSGKAASTVSWSEFRQDMAL